MQAETIIAVSVAVTGLLTGVFGAWKGFSAQKNSQKVDNFQVLYDELREEVDRVKTEQSEERKQWADERREFQRQITELTKQVSDRDVKIAFLEGQVKILNEKLSEGTQNGIQRNNK